MLISKIAPRKFGARLIIMTLFAGLVPIVIFGILLNVFGNRFAAEMSTAIAQGEKRLLEGGEAVLQKMAENHIRQRTIDIAHQLDLYLEANPEKTLQELQDDPRFREIAIQPVGETGYTALHESNTAINRFHKNPEIENMDLHTLADKLPDFWSIMEASLRGRRSGGYYGWQEADGTIREKFMYIVPLKEITADGVPLGVAATTYLDEFTQPIIAAKAAFRDTVLHLSKTVDSLILSSEKVGFSLMGVSIVLVLIMAYWFGVYFSRAITQLKQATREVNQGNMDVGLKPLMSGEVGELTCDFNEMVAHLKETTVSKARLEESERKLRTIVEHSTNLFYSHTPDHVLTYMSPMTREYLDCEPKEALIRWTEFVTDNPINREGFEHTQRAIDTGEHQPPFELELRGKEGRQIWVEVNESPVVNEGKTVAIVGALIDITERKGAEDALRKSEKRLRRAELVAQLGNWEFMLDTMEARGSDGARAIYGIGEGSWSIPDVQKIPLPEYRPMLDQALQELIERGKPYNVEFKIRRPTDGKILDIHSVAEYSPERRAVFGVIQDITERKLADEALRASEEKYRQVVENAHDAIFIAQDGFIKFPNPRLANLSGYSLEELTQKAFVDFVHPEDRELVATTHQRRMQGEEVPNTYSFRAVNKSSNTLWVELSSVFLTWEGRPASLNFLRDITLQKKLESQLVHAHKMEAVGTLAGGIAHDFNNLLQAVKGYAELLLLPKGEGEPGYRELQEICRAATRGGELTRQLLTFSRKVESRLQPVDLNRIVEDVRLLLERTIPKMIKVELHLTANLHHVNADASQIEQILMNLAVNARDAMPDGGQLLIQTRNVALDRGSLRRQPELIPGNYVLLAVTDTGQGMDRATLEHIFDPFFTTKEVGKGTGLGLAMVYGIVKSHHGHIRCVSKPGEGTTFEMYFSVFEEPKETLSLVVEEVEVRGGDDTILIVDDDESLRDLGRRILETYGYTVMSAQDGETALQVYRKHKDRIALVILDLIMPGMGGAQCLQKLLEINSGAKVVIASGYSANGETERIAESGAKAFIQKPYNVQQILKVVRKILDE